jgi:hypothetical protein
MIHKYIPYFNSFKHHNFFNVIVGCANMQGDCQAYFVLIIFHQALMINIHFTDHNYSNNMNCFQWKWKLIK